MQMIVSGELKGGVRSNETPHQGAPLICYLHHIQHPTHNMISSLHQQSNIHCLPGPVSILSPLLLSVFIPFSIIYKFTAFLQLITLLWNVFHLFSVIQMVSTEILSVGPNIFHHDNCKG